MSNHVSYSVLLSLALRALIFCLITGVVTHQSKEIHRRLFLICSISDQYRRPIFSGWVFLWKNLKLSPATHAELFRGSAPFELVGSCRPCRSWSSLLSSQPSWQLPMGWSERLEPWSSTWTFHGSNEADTLVGMIFLFQKKMLEFFEADKRYLFLVTLMFSKYVFLLKHVKSAKVAHWDGRTETAQSRCSQKKSRCGKFMGKSHRLFWICESSLELPKPVWRPNSTWVSIAILQRFFQCKHHVIQVNCFFVFFVAHYVLQHVYIYIYIYKHISIYLIIYLLRYRYVYYVLMFTDISVCVHASAQVICATWKVTLQRVSFSEFFGFHLPDKRSSGTGPFTQSQSMGGWLLRLVMCLSRHGPK